MINKNKNSIKKLITHNGSFHTDDLFACAILSIVLEDSGQKFEIIRTRDEDIVKNGDYVFDVGGIYDVENNRFDHHQKVEQEKEKMAFLIPHLDLSGNILV